MGTVSKKKAVSKEVRRTRVIKPKTGIKNIGLDEKIEEAKNLFRLLKNPELLK